MFAGAQASIRVQFHSSCSNLLEFPEILERKPVVVENAWNPSALAAKFAGSRINTFMWWVFPECQAAPWRIVFRLRLAGISGDSAGGFFWRERRRPGSNKRGGHRRRRFRTGWRMAMGGQGRSRCAFRCQNPVFWRSLDAIVVLWTARTTIAITGVGYRK
mgnify:CR=1 FL=1